MKTVLKSLAMSKEYEDEAVIELWNAFFGELDSNHLNPKEILVPTKPGQPVYEYDSDSGRRTITFGEFAKEVSNLLEGRN